MRLLQFLKALFCVQTSVTTATIISTPVGKIEGTTQTVLGTQVNAFKGIPYALPPVGDLRFKRPVSAGNLGDNVFQATSLSPPCLQNRGNISNVPWAANANQSCEDCLYLNIWTPPRASNETYPVMFWIHGGSWVIGSGNLDMYDGSVLAAMGKVIVVTFNYRLGVMGFLYANTTSCQGNMGLYDQQMALKWVYDNIASFGGNPDEITVFGQSVGGVSAGYHAMSPMSSTMVKRFIMQSLTPLWSNPPDNDKGVQVTLSIAEKCNCSTTNTSMEAIIACLRTKTPEELITAELASYSTHLFREGPIFYDDFLPKSPQELMSNLKNKDVIAGFNNNEGEIVIYMLNTTSPQVPDLPIDNTARDFWLTNFVGFLNDDKFTQAKNYVTRSDLQDQRAQVSSFLGHFLLACSVTLFGSQIPQARLYTFDYLSTMAQQKWPEWVGVTHGDEIPFIFGVPFRQPNLYNRLDRSVSQTFINFWSSFAYSGMSTSATKPSDSVQYGTANTSYSAWPTFAQDEIINFGQNITSIQLSNETTCDFIDSLLIG